MIEGPGNRIGVTQPIKAAAESENDKRNGSIFLFNCLVWIAAISPLYFPEDRQKEARVLIKEVKEKLRKLRSMLGAVK